MGESFLLILIPVLINVAFITLLERKILGYAQLRLGPNKLSWVGLTQPFADAIKLFTKALNTPSFSSRKLFFFMPVLSMTAVLWGWSFLPADSSSIESELSFLGVLLILSVGVYPIFLAGWAANSSYAILGSLRAIAQTISYEISLALIFLSVICYTMEFELAIVSTESVMISLMIVNPILGALWVITALAETNRTPFDFAEGESELVSGFNVEYSGGHFALVFMAEYASIFFMGLLTATLFMSSAGSPFFFWVKIAGLVFLWVWVRATLPRYRYDMLMAMAWKSLLPMTLGLLELLVLWKHWISFSFNI